MRMDGSDSGKVSISHALASHASHAKALFTGTMPMAPPRHLGPVGIHQIEHHVTLLLQFLDHARLGDDGLPGCEHACHEGHWLASSGCRELVAVYGVAQARDERWGIGVARMREGASTWAWTCRPRDGGGTAKPR